MTTELGNSMVKWKEWKNGYTVEPRFIDCDLQVTQDGTQMKSEKKKTSEENYRNKMNHVERSITRRERR